jgi:hypothetical protein
MVLTFTEDLSGESTAGTARIRGHTSQAIAVLDYAQTKTSVVAPGAEPYDPSGIP